MKVWVIVGIECGELCHLDTVAARYEAEYQLYRLAERENVAGQAIDLAIEKGQLLVTDNEYEPHLIKTYQIYEKDIDF